MGIGCELRTQSREENLERVNKLKYLGAALAENGDLDADMTHRMQSGWGKNWRRVSGLQCDR